jgi:hypothetical protein
MVRGTIHIDGETLINGKQYFKVVITTDLSGIPGAAPKQLEEVRYYRTAQDGIYFLPGQDIERPELLEMPLPIPIGVKWLSGATEVRAERAGTVKVGDREYNNCLKLTYKQSDGVRTTENYLAPGVGIIKTVYMNTTEPKSSIELTLEKYYL